jgi:hypothetical protein
MTRKVFFPECSEIGLGVGAKHIWRDCDEAKVRLDEHRATDWAWSGGADDVYGQEMYR